MPQRYRCPPYLQLRLVTLLTAAAVAATFPTAVATPRAALATVLDDDDGDEVGLMTTKMSRVYHSRASSMEPSVASSSSPVTSPGVVGFKSAQAREIPLAASQGRIVVAEEKAVKPSSLGAFELSSAADVWLPGNGDTFRVSSPSSPSKPSTATGFPALISALAQAQLWLACSGGIMIAFALNRARAGLTHYAQQSSQAKQSPLAQFGMSWRVDHNMVRSSALNSAG